MKLILVTVLILCISYCAYSKDIHESSGTSDDIVECVFAISKNSEITIKKQHNDSWMPDIFRRQHLQNIGYESVTVKGFYNTTLKPCHSEIFMSPITIYNNKDIRAIVYASECEVMEYPGIDYDKNKVLKETINLGVRDIPKEDLNFDTLISHFWPENKKNVWEQIYDVVKVLLTDAEQNKISNLINTDIAEIKEKMVALNNMTGENLESNLQRKYISLGFLMEEMGSLFVFGNKILNIYISPLYSNFVTMKMYFFKIGFQIDEQPSYAWITNVLGASCTYTKSMEFNSFYSLYQTIYVGGLYNVMMNARSHFSFHVLEMLPVWKKIYESVDPYDYKVTINVYPLSYSNLYGKATPNLFQEAIHITESALAGLDNERKVTKLNKILFYIKKGKKQLETVYGLKLEFSSGLSYPMGNTKVAGNIKEQELNLRNKHIIELKVYKTKSIRCLEFRFSNGETVTIGNHCNDNSVSSIFQSEGYYIHSLYLANDYPGTKKYFDNVAVSYIPKTFAYFHSEL